MKQTITPTQLTAILAIYSCRAEPIIPDGWQVPNGYTLRGPRGNRKTVCVDAHGNVPEFDVKLWLDGIAYGDRRNRRRVYQCDDCPQLRECTAYGCARKTP